MRKFTKKTLCSAEIQKGFFWCALWSPCKIIGPKHIQKYFGKNSVLLDIGEKVAALEHKIKGVLTFFSL